MEIRIKTHEELREDRVTIEVIGTGAEVREVAYDWEAKLYTTEEMAPLQASEVNRVAGPLLARITELERLVELERDRARVYRKDSDEQESRADELDRRLSTSMAHMIELEQTLNRANRDHALNLARVVDRADQAERQRADADQQYRKSIEARDLLLAEADRRIDNARTVLNSRDVLMVREYQSISTRLNTLTEAIGKALDILG